MFRRLIDRNVATLIAVVLASQLLTGILAYAFVLRPQTERIAEVTATMAGTISRAMTGMPGNQRAALLAQLNSGDAIAIRPASETLTDGDRFPTLVEREFMAAMARHLAPSDLGGQQVMRWRTDNDRHLWVQLKLGGQPYWISINAARTRGPLTSMLLAVVTSVFAAILAGVLLQRHIDRPLRRLALALDSYGAQGMPIPLDEAGPEEIAAAARALNRMTARLAEQEAERALMLAAVSHDLRTPLTRLRLALAMMHGEDLDLTESAGRQVDQIEAMLAQFLDFARAFAAEPLAMTDIAELLSGVVRDAGEGIGVSMPPVLVASVRPMALARAVDNLLANALRHGHLPVALQAGRTGNEIHVTVSDGGPGFAPDEAERLCRPFARGNSARSGEGSGLGLAIAQQVAEAHGGSLHFGPDGGRFSVRLVVPTLAGQVRL